MKLTLALVLLRLIAFQIAVPRHASGMPMADDGTIRDDLILEITLQNDRDTGNATTGSVDGTDQRNSSTNVTVLGSDAAGKNSTTDVDPAEKESTLFRHKTEETVVVLGIGLLIGVIFLSPAFNHFRKSYWKPASTQAQVDLPPRYQELMQRDDLNSTINSGPSLTDNLLPPCRSSENDSTV